MAIIGLQIGSGKWFKAREKSMKRQGIFKMDIEWGLYSGIFFFNFGKEP